MAGQLNHPADDATPTEQPTPYPCSRCGRRLCKALEAGERFALCDECWAVCSRRPTPGAGATLLPDHPDADFTDAAHPAWWRGHDAAVAGVVRKLTAVLDGKDDGRGVASGEYEVLRRRLLAMVQPTPGAEWKAHVAQFQFAEDPGPPPNLVNATVSNPTPGAGGAGDDPRRFIMVQAGDIDELRRERDALRAAVEELLYALTLSDVCQDEIDVIRDKARAALARGPAADGQG